MKFTYVATCQNYGNQKRQGDRRATDILNLMVKYVWHPLKCWLFILSLLTGLILLQNLVLPMLLFSNPSLRVAYIDEVEEREGGKVQKVYYSVLVKAVDNLDQVVSYLILNRITILIQSILTTDSICFLIEGNLPYKVARCSKDRRRKAWKSEPCYSFYSRGSSSDDWYEPGKHVQFLLMV